MLKLKKLAGLVSQDLVLSLRNALVWVVLGTLVVMVAAVRFLVPRGYDLRPAMFVADATEGRALESRLLKGGVPKDSLRGNREALRLAVAKDSRAIGALFEGDAQRPTVTLFHHGTLSKQNLNRIGASLGELVQGAPAGTGAPPGRSASGPLAVAVAVELLKQQSRPVPRNLASVPVLLVFEVLVLGFLLVAVFLFQEKSDGTFRAYRVTPGGTSTYILSKVLSFLIIGLVYGLGLVLSTVGPGANYPALVAAIVLGSSLYTLLGLIVAAFFRDISEWFFVGVAILGINMAPALSYEFPTFAPGFITWLPSHSMLFGLREMLFPTGRSLLPLFALLLGENAAAYAACHWVLNRRLMKEGSR